MKGSRRIPRVFAKVTSAVAVIAAVAIPASVMSSGVAGAATAPTLNTSSVHTYSWNEQGFAVVGQGFSGTVYFAGSGFAHDQGVGGNVSATTTAAGVTFSNVQEVSTTEATATVTTSSTTPGGFYPVTLTDDNGSATMTIGLGVDVGPQITTITGNTGTAGGGASTIVISGKNLEGAEASFSAPSGCTAPSVSGYNSGNNNTTLSFNVNNSAATACTDTLVITSFYPTYGQGATVAAYTVTAVAAALSITGINPNSLSITGLSASNLSTTSTVTISGTGFEPGAVGTMDALEGGDISGTFSYVNSTTMSGSITLKFGVTETEEDITITNPDATSVTGTGILGIGEAPASSPVSTPAPTIGCTGVSLQAGVQTIFTCTGSSTFPITTGTTFSLSLAGHTLPSESVAATVKSVTGNVATVNAPIPRYSYTTLGVTAAAASTTLTVASTAGIPTSGPLTIVDGTSTETVTISGTTATTITVSATAHAHNAGVVLEWPFAAGTYTVTANNGVNSATSSIGVLAAGSALYNGGATAGSFNPGSYSISAYVPGFDFSSGAAITFLGSTGSTGTVTPTSFSTATLNVTVPSTVPEAVTLTAAANPAQDQAAISDCTHVSDGQSLTVGPNPTDATKTTQTLVVMSLSASSGPCTVTFTTNFAQTYNSGDPVTGVTQPQPTGNLVAVLTNGLGQAELINPLLGVATPGTATMSPGTLGDGTGIDTYPSIQAGNNFFYPVEFTVAGGTVNNTSTWVINSTTAGVVFQYPYYIDTTHLGAYAMIASNVAASSSVPFTITNGQVTFTGTFTVTSSVPTVTGVTTVGTVGPNSTSETIGVYGTGFDTADPATNDFCYTTSPGLYCTIYDNGSTPPGGSTVTTDSSTVLTVVISTSWYGAVNGTEPFPSNGSYGIIIGRYSDGGSGIFSPAINVAGEPVATGATPTTVDAYNNVGTVAVTGTGFSTVAAPDYCQSLWAPPGSSSYTFTGLYCDVTVNSATSVTITDDNSYDPGTIIYEFGDDYSTWNIDTPAIQVIPAPEPSFFVYGNDLSINFDVVAGSTNAPFKLVGFGFLPGSTLSLPAADGTITAGLVTPNAIFGTISPAGNLSSGWYPVTVTNANGTTSVVDTYIYAAPDVDSINSGATAAVLEGTGTKLVITGGPYVQGATVALTNPALGTLGTAVVSKSTDATNTCAVWTDYCDTITVTVTPLSFTGAVPIVTGIVVTNPVGDGSVSDAGALTINPVPSVTGGPFFVATFTSNQEFTFSGTGFQAGMTAVSSDPTNYKILLVSVTPTSFTLLVTTSSQATSGTSATVTLTNPDGGTTTFQLNGGPPPTPPLKVSSTSGRPARIGKTTVFTIHGSFLANVSARVNKKGVTASVLSSSATQARIAISVKKTVKPGTATLHISNSNGSANIAFSIKR